MWEQYIELFTKYPIVALSDIITFVPIFVGLLCYKYLSKESKVLMYFLVFHFLLDIYAAWLSVKSINNLNVFNFAEICEVATICFIFFRLNKQSNKKLTIIFLLLLSVGIGIWKFHFSEFALIPYVLNRFCYVIIVFIYFSKLLSEISVQNILLHSPFWLCAALIIYSTGSIIIFLFGPQILLTTSPNKDFIVFYSIIPVINILFRLLIAVSFFVSKFSSQ